VYQSEHYSQALCDLHAVARPEQARRFSRTFQTGAVRRVAKSARLKAIPKKHLLKAVVGGFAQSIKSAHPSEVWPFRRDPG
jgi:hypothetical protein